MWALDVLKLTLKFPATMPFFNNPATLFLQSDILTYAALDAYYPLLLFLAFSYYSFVPEVYNAPIVVSPRLVGCRRNRPPCRDLLTAPKVLKKKKKQKDEWNKSLEVSEDEDPALQPRSLLDDPKRLLAAVTSAMKSGLTDRLIELLNFLISPMYKLAIRNHIQFHPYPALPLIPHEVDDMWIKRVPANQMLRDPTYQGGWRLVSRPNNLHALGHAFGFALFHRRICLCLRFANSPCSKF
uniref:Uncharacterized protein n=1 Tax=Romanomermis culicivorax TaxID=13658 RepID=A0A915IHV8_ROMCU